MQLHRRKSLLLPPVFAASSPRVKLNSSLIFGLGEKEWEGNFWGGKKGGREGEREGEREGVCPAAKLAFTSDFRSKPRTPASCVNSLPDPALELDGTVVSFKLQREQPWCSSASLPVSLPLYACPYQGTGLSELGPLKTDCRHI